MSHAVFSLKQADKGYRYNSDSYLLAYFANFEKNSSVCDLGCGVGVLGFLALKQQSLKMLGVEIQTELFEYAKINIADHGLENNFEVLHLNWKHIKKKLKKESFDLVVSNPPYRKVGSGELCKHSQKNIAKHELEGSMSDLMDAAKYLMKKKGRFCVIYPTVRLEDFFAEAKEKKLKIARLQMLHPFIHQKATHFMAELAHSVCGEIKIEKPCIVYKEKDVYTDEMQKWMLSCR